MLVVKFVKNNITQNKIIGTHEKDNIVIMLLVKFTLK